MTAGTMNATILGLRLSELSTVGLSVTGLIDGMKEGVSVDATLVVVADMVGSSVLAVVPFGAGPESDETGVDVKNTSGRGVCVGELVGDMVRGADVTGASTLTFDESFDELLPDPHNPIPQNVPTITAATRTVFNIIAPKMIFIQNICSSLDDGTGGDPFVVVVFGFE